jgi:hypothetical protein
MIRLHPTHRPARPAVLTLASCSPSSRTLRAASGGGLERTRPSLTAAPRDASRRSGRDEKTALQPNQKTRIERGRGRTTHALQTADIFTRHRHSADGQSWPDGGRFDPHAVGAHRQEQGQ